MYIYIYIYTYICSLLLSDELLLWFDVRGEGLTKYEAQEDQHRPRTLACRSQT